VIPEFCSSPLFAILVVSALAIYFGGLAVTCFFRGER
jgi:hypothetical protein